MAADEPTATSLEMVGVVVNRLRARHAEIARAIYDHLREAVPDDVAGWDSAYQTGVLAAVDAVLGYSLDVIEYSPGWLGPIPAEAAEQARRSARAGVALGTVLRRYVAARGCLDEFVAEETARFGLASDAAELRHISRTHHALLGQLGVVVEEEHDRERQRMMRSPEQRRIELVRRLLDGHAVGELEFAGLGYRFDAWHVGAIAVGPNAREVLQGLKADRQLLLVSDGEDAAWAWLGGRQRPTHAELERLLAGHDLPAGRLAIGEPAQALEGWRETYRQAQQALQVGMLASQTSSRYGDAAMLIPWLEDTDRGRAFVELHLSPLGGQKDGGTLMRQTLRVYLEANLNASSAACALGIHRRTLRQRLATIEACLGYPLDGRKAELELALRLHDLFDRAALSKVGSNPPIRLPTLA